MSIYGPIIKEALTNLGSTPDAIADSLRRHRIYGYRDNPNECPIANYLWMVGGKYPMVDGYISRVTINFNRVTVRAPSAVEKFVELFDSGKYPFLEM